MQYAAGKIGRIFFVAFDDGDDIIAGLTAVFEKENIETAAFVIIGAIRQGGLVTGPVRDCIPPEPCRTEIEEAHEVIGCGNILRSPDGTKIHFHGALGRKESIKAGCIRDKANTFLTAEATVFELLGTGATRTFDPASGIFRAGFSTRPRK